MNIFQPSNCLPIHPMDEFEFSSANINHTRLKSAPLDDGHNRSNSHPHRVDITPPTVSTVAGSSSSSSRRSNIFRELARNRHCSSMLMTAFFAYLVIVPMILVLIFYLDFIEMITAAIVAIIIPLVLYHLIWKHMVAVHTNLPALYESTLNHGLPSSSTAPTASTISTSPILESCTNLPTSTSALTIDHQLSDGTSLFFRVISSHWVYEIYQLLLTLLSCAIYLYYTYNLTFTVDDGESNYTLNVPSVSQFVQVEYFLIVSLSMDYFLRLMTVKHKFEFIFSLYSMIDLLCFTGVAYFNFFHANLIPKNAVYNYYLFQGPFRFLRMRRALQVRATRQCSNNVATKKK